MNLSPINYNYANQNNYSIRKMDKNVTFCGGKTVVAEKVKERRRILDDEKCKTCFLNSSCGKGCVAEAYNSGDFYGISTDCVFRKNDFLHSLISKCKNG